MGRSIEKDDALLSVANGKMSASSCGSTSEGLGTKSLDVTTSVTTSTGDSTLSEDDERTDFQEEASKGNTTDTFWHLFQDEGRDVSTLENPSLLSSESSSWERDTTTTATTDVTSLYRYESYGCCGCDMSKDDDASSSSVEASNLQEEESMDVDTITSCEQSVLTDENETWSAARTEYLVGSTNLLWDDDRLEVETQQLSKDEVLLRGGSNINLPEEQTVEEIMEASASTVDLHSLLRNLIFKKTVARVSDPKFATTRKTKFYGSNGGKQTEATEATDTEIERFEPTIEPAPASAEVVTTNALGEDQLLEATNITLNDTKKSGSFDISAKICDEALIKKNLDTEKFEDPKVEAKEDCQEAPHLDGQSFVVSPVVANKWSLFPPMTSTSAVPVKTGGILKDLKTNIGKDQSPKRLKQNKAALQVGQIGERIDNAKAKSEERRKILKQKLLTERYLSSKRKTKKSGDRLLRAKKTKKVASRSLKCTAIHPSPRKGKRSSKRIQSVSHLPICGAMEMLDSIFGGVWQGSNQVDVAKHSKRSTRSGTKRDHGKFSEHKKLLRDAPKSHQRHSSLSRPLIRGSGPGFPVEKNGGDRHQQYCITRTKRGKLIMEKSAIGNYSPQRRNIHPTIDNSLCGAGLAFSPFDDDEITKPFGRGRTKVSVRTRSQSRSKHRKPDQRESDVQAQRSSLRQRLFSSKKQKEQARPIPKTLPTSKSAPKGDEKIHRRTALSSLYVNF